MSAERFDCQECGQNVQGAAEFHPYLYCLLYKAGIHNQRQYLAMSGFFRRREGKAPVPAKPSSRRARSRVAR